MFKAVRLDVYLFLSKLVKLKSLDILIGDCNITALLDDTAAKYE